MLLTANTCLAHFLLGCDMFAVCLVMIHNDLIEIQSSDRFCQARGYFGYSIVFIFNFSFVLQAFHRYVMVVYPTRLFWRSGKNQLLFISCVWIIGFLHSIHTIVYNEIVHDINNHICQVPLRLSFTVIYL